MISSLFDALFGCQHRRTTFPLTATRRVPGVRAKTGEIRNGTYVVCLDCGKEFNYNWKEMRIEATAVPPAVVADRIASSPLSSVSR